MRAVIFADDAGESLLPLTAESCTALLPVAGKRVIERILEMFVDAGVRQVWVIGGHEGTRVRAFVGDGSRWGIQVTHLWASELSSTEAFSATALGEVTDRNESSWLIARADRVCSHHLGDFIEACADMSAATATFTSGSAGWIYTSDTAGLVQYLQGPTALGCDTIALPEGAVIRIDSYKAFYDANLSVVSGALASCSIPGTERALGMVTGRMSKVSPRSVKQGRVVIGQRCRVDPSVAFYGNSVIGDDVFIDRRAIVSSSVILPDTYVGELLNVENAIVSGADLIDVETGSCVRVTDAFLLAPRQDDRLAVRTSNALSRLLGVVIFILTLPLWIVAYVASWLEFGPRLLEETVRGNRFELNQFDVPTRRDVRLWSFSSTIPILKRLPSLLAVMTGDLRIVGVRPLTATAWENRTEDWQHARDQAPSGMLGPTLFMDHESNESARLQAEGEYAQSRSFRGDLRLFTAAVGRAFAWHAWTPRGRDSKPDDDFEPNNTVGTQP